MSEMRAALASPYRKTFRIRMASDTHKRTPLYAAHEALGARMMPFGGFEMPVQYTSIIDEHKAVRTAAGLFDVSHMGEVMVTGPEAFAFVQHLVTNDASKLYDGRAMYTVMCTPDGGIVDDLLVYRRADDAYLLVINAANIAKDVAWMRDHNPMDAAIENISADVALLALQGPEAFAIAQPFLDQPLDDLSFYHFLDTTDGAFMDCDRAIVSRTGYTGEPGLELYLSPGDAQRVWNTLLDAGRAQGLQPAGLGARDTLRLEAGYCLYGNDITTETTPYEAGLGWVVKLDAGDFVGRAALRTIKEQGPERALVAFIADGRGIPRAGYAIQAPDGTALGTVTSGTQSPLLSAGIGMGYVPNDDAYTAPGTHLQVMRRKRPMDVTVAKPPLHEQ